MRYTTIVLLCLTTPLSQAADTEHDLATLLETQSCDRVWADAGFSIDVLSRSFPVPRGFRFVGIERELIVFRRMPNSSSEITSRLPDDGDMTLQEKAVWLNRERASIAYGEKTEIVLGDTGAAREVMVLQWNGLDFFLWMSMGGGIVTTITYQAVVQKKDGSDQIAITTFDLGLVSSIVGCSK